MALLLVHQAKALRDLLEGSHDPQVLQQLHAVTNLALRVTKVMAWSVGPLGGPGMPSLAVSGRHEGY